MVEARLRPGEACRTLSQSLQRPAQPQITWIGHSTVLVEMDGIRLVTDPLLRMKMAHLRRVHAPPAEIAGMVDAVLVSHVHFDHLDLPSLRLVSSEHWIVPRGAGRLLRRRGLDAVCEVVEGEQVSVGPVSVLATHAEHRARRSPLAARVPALGFLISGSARVYFAGDTDVFPAMSDLKPKPDVGLLPISGWGPRVPSGHMDPHRAAEALALIQPRFVIPIHWGTYVRLGLSTDAATLREPAERFESLAAELAPDAAVRVLSPGESFLIPPVTTGAV